MFRTQGSRPAIIGLPGGAERLEILRVKPNLANNRIAIDHLHGFASAEPKLKLERESRRCSVLEFQNMR